ncbi:hypothetical protein FQN50_008208 [Emmonsiellopsis sp. PD_5]|nr:hypothetical protein FQN50_008208 [Emmonsiellopsis sp. PD_5]
MNDEESSRGGDGDGTPLLPPSQPPASTSTSAPPEPAPEAPSSPSSPSSPSLPLTIRFSASIPDMHLGIPDPTHLTSAGLKQLIRQRLPRELFTRRLRLIHAGKALEDDVSLADGLRVGLSLVGRRGVNVTGNGGSLAGSASASASASASEVDLETGLRGGGDAKGIILRGGGKGKAPMRDLELDLAARPRMYIHCSIGDIRLSAADLEVEASKAVIKDADETITTPATTTLPQRKIRSSTAATSSDASTLPGPSRHPLSQNAPPSSTTTTTGPRGFSRLLAAGFTEDEVETARADFHSRLSLSYTPDNMPSGAELRRLEDEWLDNEAAMGPGGGGGDGTTMDVDGGGLRNSGNDSDRTGPAALDDMLLGAVAGFFWPVGCGLWLLRETGVWSWRRGMAVFVGVVVNFGFGVVRVVG